jgi:hypothetical protein
MCLVEPGADVVGAVPTEAVETARYIADIGSGKQVFGASVGVARLPPDAKWLAGRGCEKCKQVGFKGRLAIHELLQVNMSCARS